MVFRKIMQLKYNLAYLLKGKETSLRKCWSQAILQLNSEGIGP